MAIIVPILFYPSAQAIWSAIDFAMRPLDPVEEAEAATAAEAEAATEADPTEPPPD